MDSVWTPGLLFFIGALVAFVNSVAGGGSSISLPLLIFMGLPASEANGTNRLAIFTGNLSAFAAFYRQKKLEPHLLKPIYFPVIAGAMVGAWLVAQLPDKQFTSILALTILMVSLVSQIPVKKYGGEDGVVSAMHPWLRFWAFAAVGFYGGFIQIGMGFIQIWALRYYTRLDLIRVNALKVMIAFLFVFFSLFVFIALDKIHWTYGLIMAAGSLVGGYAGSMWQIQKGEKWVKRFVAWGGIVMALKLIWDNFFT